MRKNSEADESARSEVDSNIKRLAAESAWDRRTAAASLAKQGKVAHTAIPRLIEIVGQDPDLYLRKNVLYYLYRLGNTIWEDPQPDPPANESTQPVAPTIRHLVECLAAESRHVRAVAAHLIGCFGRASYFTEFQLVKKLHDDNQKVRLNAATALRRIGAESETTVGALSEVAKNPEEKGFVRDRALAALGSMVPFSDKAMETLLWALANGSTQAIRSLVEAVAVEAAMPQLIECVKKPSTSQKAIQALATVGSAAAAATPAFVSALVGNPDKSPWTQTAAAKAIVEVGTMEDAVPQIIAELNDRHISERNAVLEALEAAGPTAAGAVRAVRSAFETADESLKQLAARAMGGHSNANVDDLVVLFQQGDSTMRRQAAGGLRQLGTAANRALPMLFATLAHDDGYATEWLESHGQQKRAATVREIMHE